MNEYKKSAAGNAVMNNTQRIAPNIKPHLLRMVSVLISGLMHQTMKQQRKSCILLVICFYQIM